jgi:exodeoxyribonuclease VII large subunit
MRALPRPDGLFALPRQRFDAASERLRGASIQNVQRHHGRFAKAATLLRPRLLQAEVAKSRETALRLEARLGRAYHHRVTNAAHALQEGARVLESVSYRAVLARGFALIRGENGKFRRRKADVAGPEKLTIVFADGEVPARPLSEGASGAKRDASVKPQRGKPGQGDLF